MDYIHYNPHREDLYPLTHTRHTSDIEAGGATLFQHVERRLEGDHRVLAPGFLESITEKNSELYEDGKKLVTSVGVGDLVYNPSVVPNGDVKDAVQDLDRDEFLYCDGTFVAGVAPEEMTAEELHETVKNAEGKRLDSSPTALRYPWDLVHNNGELIESSFRSTYSDLKSGTMSDATVSGARENIYVSPSAEIAGSDDEKRMKSLFKNFLNLGSVELDASGGPIIIEKGAEIHGSSTIEGPAYIGEGTQVGSGDYGIVHGDTHVGKHCRVGGEIGETVMHSFTNKYHSGHLGHSVVGSWVNFGAGTTNSDLKNTYGPVRFRLPSSGDDVEVGQFFGAAIGDNVRFGIQTSIFTGKAVGPFASLTGRVSENVEPFTWQNEGESKEYESEKAVKHSARMMERRRSHLPEGYISTYGDLIRELGK
jgi:acetyltransferase-like isoleucine patch superfamily enzyme